MKNKNKYYIRKKNSALAPIPLDKRIYLNVDYKPRRFREEYGCRFDSMKNLWFTSVSNPFVESLIWRFGINEQTSENALELLKQQRQKSEESSIHDKN